MTIWLRIPEIVRAVTVGLVITLLGSGSWTQLIAANTRHFPGIPWAAPIMAGLLAAWWLYFGRGRGWPESTAPARQLGGRANPVPDILWGPALGAGALGLFATLLLQGVLARLVTLPQQRDFDPSQVPLMTVAAWVVVGSMVAGVVEETAFRGYIQGGIERRHGLTVAILVTGSLFGLSHFTHPEMGVVLLPFYLSAAAVYGLLTAATDSVFPSMILHAAGNMLSAIGLFTGNRSEWQLAATTPTTIWQTGIDGSFLFNLVALGIVGAAASLAYRALFKMSGASKAATPGGAL